MKKLSFDYLTAKDFINEHELDFMNKQVSAMADYLVGKTGPGKDFLGWIDLPIDYDKSEFEIIEPQTCTKADEYAMEFYNRRQRKGITLREARQLMNKRIYLGSMMLSLGDANALISGLRLKRLSCLVK